MTTEWKDLTTLQEVAQAQADGWEIEICSDDVDEWVPWIGKAWCEWKQYRGLPKQPRMKKVVSECWREEATGNLIWMKPTAPIGHSAWQRFPAGDIEGEAEA